MYYSSPTPTYLLTSESWKLPSIICKQSTCTSCLSIKHWLLVHYYHLNNNINLFLTALQLDRPVPRYKEDTETFIDHVQLWSATTRNHRCTFLSWLWFLVVYPRTLHNTMHVQYAPYFYCLYIYQTTFTKQHSMFHLLMTRWPQPINNTSSERGRSQ